MIPTQTRLNFILISVVIVLLVIGGLGFKSLLSYSNEQAKDFDGKIAVLQKEIADMQVGLSSVNKNLNTPKPIPPKEVVYRQVIREKSQEELLTAAVAKITPSVVSIVISKDVPKLEVSYENPFGDDPFFKDYGFRVPVYKQKGVEYQKVGAGTGFIINPNGYILTNKHVVSDMQADYTVLLSTGEQKVAKVVYRDPDNDMAIVKIDGTYTPVELGDSSVIKLGQSVFAVGNALGEYNNSVSVGIISGLNRNIEASGDGQTEKLTGIIQTDAAINPGNSGGPLVNLDGQVVGINVATAVGSNNISFSIPINSVKSVIKNMVSF